MKTTKKEKLPDENTQKILNEITQNLFESITALTDATTLLSKNPETKKYLEDNEKLENEINFKKFKNICLRLETLNIK